MQNIHTVKNKTDIRQRPRNKQTWRLLRHAFLCFKKVRQQWGTEFTLLYSLRCCRQEELLLQRYGDRSRTRRICKSAVGSRYQTAGEYRDRILVPLCSCARECQSEIFQVYSSVTTSQINSITNPNAVYSHCNKFKYIHTHIHNIRTYVHTYVQRIFQ
jgi:hypothetical protein